MPLNKPDAVTYLVRSSRDVIKNLWGAKKGCHFNIQEGQNTQRFFYNCLWLLKVWYRWVTNLLLLKYANLIFFKLTEGGGELHRRRRIVVWFTWVCYFGTSNPIIQNWERFWDFVEYAQRIYRIIKWYDESRGRCLNMRYLAARSAFILNWKRLRKLN